MFLKKILLKLPLRNSIFFRLIFVSGRTEINMKKGKKFLVKIIFLLIVATAVFFLGWVSFFVKEGTCTIMQSKTGGLYEDPIEYGQFVWRAERLLPTNVTLTSYKLSQYEVSKSYSGGLPSANLYKEFVNPNPDFSYELEFKMALSLTADAVLEAVKNNSVSCQEDLDKYVEGKADVFSQKITEYLLQNKKSNIMLTLSQDDIKNIFSDDADFSKHFKIDSVELKKVKIPDVELYEIAKKTYQEYHRELDLQLREKAQSDAELMVEQNRTMAQLEKFSQLLKKYPELQEFSKNTDINTFMNTIRNLK